MMMYPLLDMFGRPAMYKGLRLWMHPMLDSMGVMQKDLKTCQPMMFPSGVPMLDMMGHPIMIDFG